MSQSVFNLLSMVVILMFAIGSYNTVAATLKEDYENNETTNYREYGGIRLFDIDRECAMVGGMCVEQKHCSPGQLTSTSGLCPTNKHLGVECCYELPIRKVACRQHLGECMTRCHKTLQRPSTDCSSGQMCCVLV